MRHHRFPARTRAARAGRNLPGMVAGVLVAGLLAAAPQALASDMDLFAYQPPVENAPAARIGGASRGESSGPALEVLLPDHVAGTVSAQPTLYWFVSAPLTAPVEMTLMSETGIDPVLSTRIAPPIEAGLHALDLKAHGVTLEDGTVYDWSVAIIHDEAQRSLDTFASGALRRIAPPGGLDANYATYPAAQRATALAKAGVWIDGLDALSTAQSQGDIPSAVLATVLDGQGLTNAAGYVRDGR